MVHPIKSLARPRIFLIAVGLVFSSAFIQSVFSAMHPTDWCNDSFTTSFGLWWGPSLYLAQALGLFVISKFRRSGKTTVGLVIAALTLATTAGLLYEYDTEEVRISICCGNPGVENPIQF